MKCVIQRVRRASVHVGVELVSEIGVGLLVLAAVEKGDARQMIVEAAKKIRELRIFGDEAGKMNRDVAEAGGAILAVSQFTLAGSLARGRRPSFDNAEEPNRARELFEQLREGAQREPAAAEEAADPREEVLLVGQVHGDLQPGLGARQLAG